MHLLFCTNPYIMSTSPVTLYTDTLKKSEKMFCIFFHSMRPWFASPVRPQFLKNTACFPNTVQDCGLSTGRRSVSGHGTLPLSTWSSLAVSLPPAASSVPPNPHSLVTSGVRSKIWWALDLMWLDLLAATRLLCDTFLSWGFHTTTTHCGSTSLLLG